MNFTNETLAKLNDLHEISNSYVNTPEQLYAREVDRDDEGPNRLPWWWCLKADQ